MLHNVVTYEIIISWIMSACEKQATLVSFFLFSEWNFWNWRKFSVSAVEQLDCCKYSYCSQTNRTGGLDLSEVLCSSEAGNLMLSANPWSQKKKGLKRKVWVFVRSKNYMQKWDKSRCLGWMVFVLTQDCELIQRCCFVVTVLRRPSSTNSGSPVVRIASARIWPECHMEPPSRCQIN